jgi:hypothetical protein
MSEASSRNLRDWIRFWPEGGCALLRRLVRRFRRMVGRAWRECKVERVCRRVSIEGVGGDTAIARFTCGRRCTKNNNKHSLRCLFQRHLMGHSRLTNTFHNAPPSFSCSIACTLACTINLHFYSYPYRALSDPQQSHFRPLITPKQPRKP